MPPVERAPARGVNPSPDLSYNDVRQSFLARLQGEQARLTFLSNALGAIGSDTVAAFGELERFAHRLRGAAAVFDVPMLREDSKALELLAAHAARQRAPNNDPRVSAAVKTLTAQLALLNCGPQPSAIASAVAPGSTNQ